MAFFRQLLDQVGDLGIAAVVDDQKLSDWIVDGTNAPEEEIASINYGNCK